MYWLITNYIMSDQLTAVKLVRSADLSPQPESGLKSALQTVFCYRNQQDTILPITNYQLPLHLIIAII